MTAENYVKRIKEIDVILKYKRQQEKRWRERADGFGGASLGERVQSSRNLQPMATAVDNYLDIGSEIRALENEQRAIRNTLERLPAKEYEVLMMYYVEEQGLKVIACEFGRSYEWAKVRKAKALRLLQNILNKKGG